MDDIIIKRCGTCGYVGRFTPDFMRCNKCDEDTLQVTRMTTEEFDILCDAAPGNDEIHSLMIDLKEKDPIEYQLKMSQFKTQVQQQESMERQSSNTVKCPRCRSANITAGQRGYSLLAGFIGSGSTVNRCAKCGYKWKP